MQVHPGHTYRCVTKQKASWHTISAMQAHMLWQDICIICVVTHQIEGPDPVMLSDWQ